MSFDWKTYIKVANELINNQKIKALEEAYLRSAISRSYYGVFGVANSYLKNKGITIPAIDTHKSLRHEFKNSTDKTMKKIGQDLDRLWRDRKDADYEGTISINLNKAQLSYQMAVRILQNFKNLSVP